MKGGKRRVRPRCHAGEPASYGSSTVAKNIFVLALKAAPPHPSLVRKQAQMESGKPALSGQGFSRGSPLTVGGRRGLLFSAIPSAASLLGRGQQEQLPHSQPVACRQPAPAEATSSAREMQEEKEATIHLRVERRPRLEPERRPKLLPKRGENENLRPKGGKKGEKGGKDFEFGEKISRRRFCGHSGLLQAKADGSSRLPARHQPAGPACPQPARRPKEKRKGPGQVKVALPKNKRVGNRPR